jgi:hypothetical protein
MSDRLLPPGTRLLHIGPHKTGTTALQIAFGKNREVLLAQGVRYIWGGEHLNANLAALAVAGRPTRRFSTAKPVPIEHWTSLVDKANAASPHECVVISGEEFCSADSDTIQKIVTDLGANQLHIVITLRPLEKVLVSQWQQYVQGGSVTAPLETWVNRVLARDYSVDKVQGFWERHEHAELVRRWVSKIGKENVTVIALDERDRSFLFRTFESLIGVSQGTLIGDDRLVNRSLTLEEAEAVRSMYALLKERGLEDLTDHVRFMISPSEIIKRERVPSGRETKITLAPDILKQVRIFSAEMISEIILAGVRILGDPLWLTPTEDALGTAAQSSRIRVETIPADLAGWTAYGVVVSSGISRGDLPPAPTSTLPFAWLRRATGPQLLREVLRRSKIRLRQPYERLRGRDERKKDG